VDGDDEFRWLFAIEYPTVVRTVYFVLHDHARAEEIARDSFVQLLRHWGKVSRYDSPEAWVRRVAIRLAIRDAKRERRLALLTPRGTAEMQTYDTVMDVALPRHRAVRRPGRPDAARGRCLRPVRPRRRTYARALPA
jgi:DNA-directed RNA polymerase specialized sigma24 family protein